LAKKHRKEKPERTPTRHQLSKWEKQRRISRIITIVSIAFFVIVVGLIGYGYYNEQIMPYQKTVIKVNDTSFSMDYYIKTMDVYTKGQSGEVLKYYQDVIVQAIQQSEIVREKAGDLGISVTDDDINKEIGRSNLTRNEVTYDIAKAGLLSSKIIEQVCLPKQPAGVEQVEAQAMFLETRQMADDRRAKVITGENFTTLAGMLSLESTTHDKKGYLGWIARGYEQYSLGALANSVLKDVVFDVKPGDVSLPVYDATIEKPYGYWIIEVIEKDDTKGVHARGILLSNKDDAESVKKRLSDGENFESLAKQFSQHSSKDSGGDMGWIVPGLDKTILGRVLSSLNPHVISEAIRDESVKTKGGYWIVQVKQKDANRPLDESIKQALSSKCLSDWLSEQAKSVKMEILLDQQQKDWAVGKVLKNRGK
jgi:parvulin-like peptidyl-prolyl isomerase